MLKNKKILHTGLALTLAISQGKMFAESIAAPEMIFVIDNPIKKPMPEKPFGLPNNKDLLMPVSSLLLEDQIRKYSKKRKKNHRL